METTQVTFRNLEHSDAIEQAVLQRADKLEHFFSPILGCRVIVEAPHKHHRKGRLYHVRIDVSVAGRRLVINRERRNDPAHSDVYLAIRDAFDAAERVLHEHGRVKRGVTKRHARVAGA